MNTQPASLRDFEALARERMHPAAYDYYAGGAGDEWTLAENGRAFERLTFRPRVLVDVSCVNTSVELLGQRLSCPVLLAPTAFNRLAHPDGELAAARAAAAVGTVMVVSTFSTWSLEEISAAASPLWFQLYVHKDREVTRDLVQRAHAAGYRALVVTVDVPVLGRRDRDVRNRFMLPAGINIKNFDRYAERAGRTIDWRTDFGAYIKEQLDPSLDWDAVAWIKSLSPLPLVLKGILSAEDARLAVGAGVQALVVSNHGGRQLDGLPATIDALVPIVDAVGQDTTILMDGGVRRGTDVLKALAVGARAVLVGRAYLWGLAAGGEAGVRQVLDTLKTELETAMALTGRPTLAAIDASLVTRSGDLG